jgi:Tfp pilus assembly protein PilN
MRRAALSVLGGFTVVLLAWCAVALYQTSAARDSLDAAQADVQRLTGQQADYADLVSAQGESRAISAQLNVLFADDLKWPQLLAEIRRAVPTGVEVSGVVGGRAVATGAKPANHAELPRTSAMRVVGSLTITGTARNNAAAAAYLDALAKADGLASPLLSSVTAQDAGLLFTVQVDITEAAVGGRYTSDQPKGK